MSADYRPTPLDYMIREQIMGRGVSDPRVLAAMRGVPRDRFVPPDHRDLAFADRALLIGHEQTISQPYIVALMTERLRVEPTHRVLEVGCGSGYQTAILARLAAEVYAIERIKPLLDRAWEVLSELGVRNVHFRLGDGTAGWPEHAPFDRVLIAAAAPRVPRRLLLGQLADGGLAVLPVGEDDQQELVVVEREGAELRTTPVCGCRFVRLVGEEGFER